MAWEDKQGEGRWIERVNEKGESSIQTHELKTVWKSCTKDDHYYELTGNREVTCKKCGAIRQFVLGIEDLIDGSLVPVKPLKMA